MVKRCQWGLCNSDSRYLDRLEGGRIRFIPFPKPKRNLQKCKRWIKACGRPHEQLNIDTIDGNYHMYVCTKHFDGGEPCDKFPDPFPADTLVDKITPARAPPKRRPMSEPPKKRRNIMADITQSVENDDTLQVDENVIPTLKNAEQQTEECTDVNPLDLLDISAENKTLKQQLARQILINEEIRHNNACLKKQAIKDSKSKDPGRYTVQYVQNSHVRNNFKYHTGFTYDTFMNIFKFLVPNKDEAPMTFEKTVTKSKNISLEDQLLLTLMKLRLNFEFKHLGNLFKMSPQDTGVVFRTWVNYMFYRFGEVTVWPDRSIIQQNMPTKFRDEFPDTFIILDGTELKVQKPSSLRSQSQCYSDYKSSTTLKGLVGVDPRGSFTFISTLFSGSISDKEITTESGLLVLLQQLLDCGKLRPGDGVMVDKGFLIKDEIEKLGLKLLIPPFAPGCGQMSPADVALTKKIAAHRVHVERAISRAKKFKIVDDRISLSLFPCVNQIWFVCCFLTGFMPLLIQD